MDGSSRPDQDPANILWPALNIGYERLPGGLAGGMGARIGADGQVVTTRLVGPDQIVRPVIDGGRSVNVPNSAPAAPRLGLEKRPRYHNRRYAALGEELGITVACLRAPESLASARYAFVVAMAWG